MNKLLALLKNPITGLVISTALAIALYFVSTKNIKPSYAISEAELLAEITNETPKLKLLWEENEIKNIYSQKILIFNNGRKYIDKADISTTNPLTISFPKDIKILFHKFTKTSRSNLQFEVNNLTEDDSTKLILNIKGDEALEFKDGGLLNILYSGQKLEDINLNGRIKGSPNGLSKEQWNEVVFDKTQKKWWLPLVLLAMTFLLIVLLIIFKLKLKERGRPAFDWLDKILYLLLIFFVFYIFYEKICPIVLGLDWVS